jgi:hypothetical protein
MFVFITEIEGELQASLHATVEDVQKVQTDFEALEAYNTGDAVYNCHEITLPDNMRVALTMKDPDGNFAGGFDVIGPFTSDGFAQGCWEGDTRFDNPHWVGVPLHAPKGVDGMTIQKTHAIENGVILRNGRPMAMLDRARFGDGALSGPEFDAFRSEVVAALNNAPIQNTKGVNRNVHN